ncbi:MAG: hypothetical protein IPM37_23275 [Hahellaceae bacterium]|nr:hypothetical protein [Hahellaceae bacterium]
MSWLEYPTCWQCPNRDRKQTTWQNIWPHHVVDTETAEKLEAVNKELKAVQDELSALRKEMIGFKIKLNAKQAKIDELMFEFCPEEMTKSQIDEYEKWVRPYDEESKKAT